VCALWLRGSARDNGSVYFGHRSIAGDVAGLNGLVDCVVKGTNDYFGGAGAGIGHNWRGQHPPAGDERDSGCHREKHGEKNANAIGKHDGWRARLQLGVD
jgi:hypothetical protein